MKHSTTAQAQAKVTEGAQNTYRLIEHVSEAFLFSLLVAVFAYAVAGNSWREPERLEIPQVPGYLRSLTRRMKQEADSVPRRRVECIN